MNRSSIFAVPGLLALAFAGCAGQPAEPAPLTGAQQESLARELKGRVAEAPRRCIPYRQGLRTVRISDSVLLYDDGAIVYRNDLTSTCPGFARRGDAMVMDVRGNTLCAGESFRLLDTSAGIPGGICQLGEFIPYRRGAG